MRRRRGLQGRWGHVVNSLQEIIPSYELASSRIALHSDKRMRTAAVAFAVRPGSLVLDLGAGPGTMSRAISAVGGEPVLLDVSGAMLASSRFPNKVRGAFEFLPFRDEAFDAVVSGFALRDSFDLWAAIRQVARVLRHGGRLGFCDLGKPDSAASALSVALYLRVMPGVIGLFTVGPGGLRYGSIFDTYILAPHNSELKLLLSRAFPEVALEESQMGGSIVVKCLKP